jgi:hypothetical protein
MASESSFDIVCIIDMQEMDNAINQAMQEVSQRYDFKGSKSNIDLDKGESKMTLTSEDDYKLSALVDILQTKLVKRKISLKALGYGSVEPAAGGTVRQVVTLQNGIPQDKAKEIVKVIKGLKMKVNAAIQGDQLRVSGKKLDDLQAIMEILKGQDFGIHMQFVNYR